MKQDIWSVETLESGQWDLYKVCYSFPEATDAAAKAGRDVGDMHVRIVCPDGSIF
jgi:hypothetical protein